MKNNAARGDEEHEDLVTRRELCNRDGAGDLAGVFEMICVGIAGGNSCR